MRSEPRTPPRPPGPPDRHAPGAGRRATPTVPRATPGGNAGIATDDQGNRYVVYGNDGVQGRRPVDPQFALRPGESRTATFAIRRYATGRGELGRTVIYDVAVEELELLAGGQVRSARQHSLSFPALATGVR